MEQLELDLQERELERVSQRIEPAVYAFLRRRLASSRDRFHMEELLDFVLHVPEIKVAPASPDRILRSMRQKGVIDYQVLDRAKSLYRIKGVQRV